MFHSDDEGGNFLMQSSHSLEVLVNFQIPEILAGYLKLL
jgi:hypothetical protein